MKKRVIKTIIGFLVMLIFILLSFLFDKEIIIFIASLRNIFLDYFLISVFFASNVFIILFFIGSIFLFKQEKRKWIFPLAFAILLSAIVSFAIKTLIGRLRPFQEGLVSVLRFLFYFMKESVNTWNYSFPSFQAMLVFSVYPIICKEFNKFKYIWFIFACLIAFSRVYFGVHYMSDILVGAVVGYFIGLFAVWVEEQTGFGIKLAKKIKLIVD